MWLPVSRRSTCSSRIGCTQLQRRVHQRQVALGWPPPKDCSRDAASAWARSAPVDRSPEGELSIDSLLNRHIYHQLLFCYM